jgi:hypothetical protein
VSLALKRKREAEVKVDIDKAIGFGDTTYECGVYFEE